MYDAVVIRGVSLFFTGSAGTGKSFLLKAIIRGLEDKNTAVTAPTGVAAINIGGVTLHKYFDLMKTWTTKPAIERIKALDVLIVDEVSMLGAATFDRICELLDKHRKGAPLQYVFCGDFMQLPPIDEGMCFLSANWKKRVGTFSCLKQIVRQKDATFCGILNRARFGAVTDDDLAVLNASREVAGVVDLHTHRADTDATNNERLGQLEGPSVFFHAEDSGDVDLLSNCQAPRMLELRIGARVMLVRNIYRMDGLLLYVNGSTGSVVTAEPFTVRVLFDDGDIQTLEHTSFQVKEGKKVLATRLQYPLALAYATTIHKAQGLTIARVRVRLTAAFAPGQAYVALSRATALEHLVIDGLIRKGTFQVDRGAARFMSHIESL